MPTNTTHRGYKAYNDVTDADETFLSFRGTTNGTIATSNINKIDTDIQGAYDGISGLAGTGRTTETVYQNAQNILTIKNQITKQITATSSTPNIFSATNADIASYYNGLVILASFNSVNTGIATININTLGAKQLSKIDATGNAVSLSAGDLQINRPILFKYNGTTFVMISGNTADQINITDSGNLITATTVEGALQEIETDIKIEEYSTTSLNTSNGNVISINNGFNGICKTNISGATIDNAVTNPDFANGTTGWLVTDATLSVSGKVLSIVGTGSFSITQINQVLQIVYQANKKIKAGALMARVTNSSALSMSVTIFNSSAIVSLGSFTIPNPVQNQWYDLSNIISLIGGTAGDKIRIYIRAVYADAATANGKVMEIDGKAGVIAWDLGTSTDDKYYNKTNTELNDMISGVLQNGLNSVSNLSVTSCGKNLFDKTKATRGSYINATTGVITVDTLGSYSEPMPVRAGETYKISGKTGYYIGVTSGWAFYDKFMTFISGYSDITARVAPANAAFVRCSVLIADLNTFQFEKASVETTYEPYVSSTFASPKPLRAVPAIADTITWNNGEHYYTQNIQEYVLQSSDITGLVTTDVNFDSVKIIRTNLQGIISQNNSAIGNKDIAISNYKSSLNSTPVDTTSEIRYLYDNSGYSAYPVLIFTKGTYVNLAAAQSALTGTKILYQLATPIVTKIYNKNNVLLSFYSSTTFSNITASVFPSIDITYPTNIKASVDELNINLYGLSTKVSNLLEDNDSVEYGMRWDETNDIIYRTGAATDYTNFDEVYPWNSIKRCILSDNGVVKSYYGDPNYVTDGTLGQVMVEIPKFYLKYSSYIESGKTYHDWKISGTKGTGYDVHPAFIKDGSESNKIYISAYEGCLYDTSTPSYILNDAQIADFTVSTGDKLSSISGAKPISGLTQALTIANSRILAQNRGTGWNLWNGNQVAALQHLFMIEYASFNSQTKIGLGVVNKTDDGTANMSNVTGATNFLGNKSGREVGADGLTSVSYRGIENIWGNIWKFVDGINIQANNKLWINRNNNTFTSDTFSGNYVLEGTLSNVSGYVSKILPSKYGLFATQSSGSSSTRIPDYYYQTTGNKIALLGGYWSHSVSAGFDYLSFDSHSGSSYRAISCRLCYQ